MCFGGPGATIVGTPWHEIKKGDVHIERSDRPIPSRRKIAPQNVLVASREALAAPGSVVNPRLRSPSLAEFQRSRRKGGRGGYVDHEGAT